MTIPSKAFEYYLQGFRLNSQMTKKGNAQAQEMFKLATQEAPDFARAYGHLAYTRLLAWLNGWIESSKPPGVSSWMMRQASWRAAATSIAREM